MLAFGGALVLLFAAGVVWFVINLFFGISEFVRSYKMVSVLPGPGSSQLLQHFKLGKKAFTLAAASDAIIDAIFTYAPTFKFWSGPVLFVIITDPQDLEYFFTNKDLLDKSTLYRYLEPLMGKGLVFLNGGTWRVHRKVITPFLHSDILREYVNEFHKKSITLAGRLDIASEGGSKTVNLNDYLGLATADMICKTVLATEMATQDLEERRFVKAVPFAMKLLLLRIMCPWYMNESVFKMCSRHFKSYIRVRGIINDFIGRIVLKKRATKETNTHISQGGRRAFIDLLVNSEEGDKLNDEEVREETKTLVTVASGGTTDTLGFIFQILALKQDIQDEVVRELHAVLDGTDGDVTANIVTQLPYLDRVVKETLRLFPAIPLFARAVRKDTTLPSGVVVPRGAHLVACVLATHRNEKNFPNALKFDPDRHLPERRWETHPFAFVPFSAGPRNCIGQRYAMLAIKTIVATILMRFRLVPGGERIPKDVDDILLNLGVTLTGRGGYPVRLLPRDDKTAFDVVQPRVPPA